MGGGGGHQVAPSAEKGPKGVALLGPAMCAAGAGGPARASRFCIRIRKAGMEAPQQKLSVSFA
jgi:hypothetical protein